MNFSNQLHQQSTSTMMTRVRHWMLRSYQKHLAADGSVDAESLAEQAAWEFGCNRELADDLADEVKSEVDN